MVTRVRTCGRAGSAVLIQSEWTSETIRLLVMQAWTFITAFGDSAVLMPCAIAIFFWLGLAREAWSLAWLWLLLFGAMAALVVASKLMFMAWGLGIPLLNFTGISGHSAMSAVVWPALLALLWPTSRGDSRVAGAAVGLLFALTIAVSRVAVHAHSWTEILAGFSLGGGAVSAFLWKIGPGWHWKGSRWPAVLTLLFMLAITYGHRFPSERVLRFVAQHLSLESTVHTRRSLHESNE